MNDLRIILGKKAERFLQKLPKEQQARIMKKLEQAEKDPLRYFERLEGRADYKLRIGSIRIIADLEPDLVAIRKIGHRKDIYEQKR
ncbi:hypothetical protein JW826_02220 [Candidatus Woesearchaeota archaeon]|nr:hypothetical protein [Candidatus Woesearchaeota archaeon]